MSGSKNFDKIAWTVAAVMLIVTILFMNGSVLGLEVAARTMGYEDRLFDTSRVHTLDIVMNDWEDFLENCENEEYASATVVIDGEAYKNVGIRAKGNTSLSSVKSMGSQRYSFKVEFDQYDSAKSYYGLDKLSLNNLIQDNTMMKDYLTYRMMGEFGVNAPLCSYVYITVNREDWGLYLAVEGVEDAFLERNFGADYGELYKPDSLSFGGGRGNGMDFSMDDFMRDYGEETSSDTDPSAEASAPSMESDKFDPSAIFGGQLPEDFDPSSIVGDSENAKGFDPSAIFGQSGEIPEDVDLSSIFGEGMKGGGFGGDMFGSMGSSDVKLQYIDDDPSSYKNIFNNAKTDITEADQNRLIAALKVLSAGEDIEDVVDVEQVIRYFVVHNFVCNGDSYTGTMIHNYYLYEEDGVLSMIPWDYNLAFGTFQSSDATDAVNTPIDTPVSSGSAEDRPMLSWIFADEAYTELYHQYFAEFLESIDFAALIDETAKLIAPYVEKDPSKFCTTDEFETGVETIRHFCLLREESIEGQLNGTIPSTTAGQTQDSAALVDASVITISDMGSMGNTMGGGGGFGNMMPGNLPNGISGEGTDVRDGTQMPGGVDGALPEGTGGNSTQMQSEQTGGNAVSTMPEGMAENVPQTPTDGAVSDRTQRPDNGSGSFPSRDFADIAPDSSFTPNGSTGIGSSTSGWIWIGVSVLILAIGLIVAKKFKR